MASKLQVVFIDPNNPGSGSSDFPGVNGPAATGGPTLMEDYGAGRFALLEHHRRDVGVAVHDDSGVAGEELIVMRHGIIRDCDGSGEGWQVGDTLWADQVGFATNVRPSASMVRVRIGTVFSDGGGSGPWSVFVDVKVLPPLGELSGVDLESAAPVERDLLFVTDLGGVLGFQNRRFDHGDDNEPTSLLDPEDHPMLQRKHGFAVGSDGAALVTISYSPSTRVVTVTPTGSTFKFYIDGVEFEKTGAQAAPAHDATIGKHFIYYDANGTLQKSTSAWSIRDRTVTPVAIVYYYSATLAICFYECHTADRTLEQHYKEHFSEGTRLISGFALSGYTLNTDTDAGVTFAIAAGTIADEDIIRTLSAVPDNGPYTVMYRTGAAGDWTWITTPVLPFAYGATYVQYNNPNGGGAGVWGLTELSGIGGGTWVNYYLVAVPSVDAATQLILIPGQTTYASRTAAQGASISEIAWGTIPFEELAPLYRLTFHARSTYGGSRKTRLESVTAITQGGASVTQASSPSIHNSLASRDAADAHPASSITFTPYTGTVLDLAATTVQAAIEEIADEVATGVDALDDIGDVNAPSPSDGDVLVWDDGNAEWIAAPPGAGLLDLDDLGDVSVPTPDDGDVLTWDDGTASWVNAPAQGGASALDDLTDVNAPTPNDGDVLAWDDTNGWWEPVAPGTPGAHASTHENGGGDEIEVESLGTAETDTDLRLAPDGTGGVEWVTGGGGGGTVHHQYRFAVYSPLVGVFPLTEVTASCEVKSVRVIHTGSGDADVNVIKNYRGTPSDILDSDLDSSSSSWSNAAASGGGVSLSSGDELDVEIVSVTGLVEYLVVIVDVEEAL